MKYVLCLFDAVLLAGAGALMASVLQAQGYPDAGLVSLAVGLVGAGLAWIAG